MPLPTDITALQNMVTELLTEVKTLQTQVATLKLENDRLKAALAQDSRNSHRPPSSDGLRKKPAFPRKKGGKRGGKQGHKGKTLDFVTTPDYQLRHRAQRCECGEDLSELPQYTLSKRQVFELPSPKLEVTEHQVQACICPRCNRLNKGNFPTEVKAHTQYGPKAKALAILLNNAYKLPYRKVRQFFNDVFGYPINEATQYHAQKQCFERLESLEKVHKTALLQSPVNHFDETGMRVKGKLHWLHCCSNEQWTYLFIHQNRGNLAIQDHPSILPQYKGWDIHDCWLAYFLHPQCQHAVCGAHLLRELHAVEQNGRQWAARMKELLLYAYEQSNQGRRAVLNQSVFRTIDLQYERICRQAHQEEPLPQKGTGHRPKQTKGRNLLKRLKKHKNAVLAFAKYPKVPFTNNQAERDLRPAKIKQKVSGGFRTLQGAHYFARIFGAISTFRKQQLNVFNQFVSVVSQNLNTQ